MGKNGGSADNFYTDNYVSSGYRRKELSISAAYRRELDKHPLLTKKIEQELGRKIEYAHHGILSALCEYKHQTVNGLSFLQEEMVRARNSAVNQNKGGGKNELETPQLKEFLSIAEGIDSLRVVNGENRNDYYNKVSDLYDRLFEMTCYGLRRSIIRSAARGLLEHLQGRIKMGKKGQLEEFSRQLAKDIKLEDKSTDELVKGNLRLVCKHANYEFNRHQKLFCGMSLLDLIQHGNMGLMKAAEKFDFRRGYKFSTYATWWIRQSIWRGISSDARTVRLPIHIIDSFTKYVKNYDALVREQCRLPSREEIADRCGMSIDDVDKFSKMPTRPILLSTPIVEEGSEYGELLVDEQEPDPYSASEMTALGEKIERALVTLTPREEKVLRLRFGFDGHMDHTLEEVGQMFGLTRERIRQIQNTALRKLKQEERREMLEDYGEVY